MHFKALIPAVALLLPTAASAATFYRADLAAANGSGVTGFIAFTLDGNLLGVDLQASGLADGVHFLHIHGLDAAPGVAVDTPAPTPPVPPTGDADGNGVVDTGEAKQAIGGVILSLAPHDPGVSAELSGVLSSGGLLSFTGSYDLSQDIFEPGFTEADLLPLDFRVFDMHGGIVPAGVPADGSTSGAGTFDPNLPIAAGAIALVGTSAVPEPAGWAMMVAGFGVVGTALRRRQRVAVRFG